MKSVEDLKLMATQVRRDIIRMVGNAASGHPGGSLGCADFMTALYFEVMEHDPQNFTLDGTNQDVFFLSNGHISPVFYSVLARSGYFPIKDMAGFRKLGSKLQGHPTTHSQLPGVRMSSGSLGQGLSVGIGAAMAKKMNGDNHLVYTLHGDGELQEGQIWEAVLFAGARKVDNIIACVDYNKVQIDGTTDEVVSLGDLKQKFIAFGWEVLECNGNDMEDVLRRLKDAKAHTGKQKPIALLLHTLMGFGVDFMQGTNKWHGQAPNADQVQQALAQLPETLGDF